MACSPAPMAALGHQSRRRRHGYLRHHAQAQADFLLHSGDTIYADGVIAAEVKLPDGKVWSNVTIPEKAKVAETLDEFRAAHKYNFLDDNLRAFNAEVPIFVQWDDHEVMNNWSASKEIPAAYKVRDISLLAARAGRAFHQMYPMRESFNEPGRVYRTLSYGPHLDVFMLDERSYRGPNDPNLQTSYGPESYFIGPDQLLWLKRALLNSRATWKVVASDMPLSLIVYDDAEPAAIRRHAVLRPRQDRRRHRTDDRDLARSRRGAVVDDARSQDGVVNAGLTNAVSFRRRRRVDASTRLAAHQSNTVWATSAGPRTPPEA
jgi:phosphodiesterase/alkaline phosphatase D-like protein